LFSSFQPRPASADIPDSPVIHAHPVGYLSIGFSFIT
jgi:hypothetical protein